MITADSISRTGGIILKIHHLAATFGRLNNQTLELRDGLNILQAPNETGKSTWCAFLAAMFYGINSRERDRSGFIADKNRYAPWSGSPMQGRMDCIAGGQALTLLRETRRAAAPMGQFQAVYTGTGQEYPGLTAANCGEVLLGVPREIFERSAFIRQSGLGITADKELERRIAALITSGEEDTSYTEAAAALKKQLNRRQSNQKTGLIPAAQAELAEVRGQLRALQAYQQTASSLRSQLQEQAAEAGRLDAQLTQWKQYRAAQHLRQLQAARQEAADANAAAAVLRQTLNAEHVPESETIARLRGAIVNLEVTRKSVQKARDIRDDALKQRLRAETAVNESPFAGQTPESARKEAAAPPQNLRWNSVPSRLTQTSGLLIAALAGYLTNQVLPPSSWHLAAAAASFLAISLLAALIASRMRRSAKQAAQSAALIKRFGTDRPGEITALADAYCQQCQALETARADAAQKSAAAEALYNTLNSNEQAILLEIRRFSPDAFDISAGDRLLRESAVRRKALADAETKARAAAFRCEVLSQQAGGSEEPGSVSPPPQSEEALTAALEAARQRQAGLQSQLDRITGQIAATGDPAVLAAQAEALEARTARLTEEYQALSLAMKALDSANTSLQNRFSPELGRRAAEVFSALTGGRYTGVLLDRAFRLSAEPKDDPVFRDAQLLSAGTLDQLYLAVRLAICDLVLPAEKEVPLILDDALTNFDDQRCAAALRYLQAEAKHRQILLFTCHSREADFFAGNPDVYVQRLSNF